MKRLTTIFLLCITLLSVAFNASAITHVITVEEFQFTPANIPNVMVGDTIKWQWLNGSHTTTSVTVPSGAASWDSPINSSTPVFSYVVQVAGIYDYKCTPHESMGMTGIFFAAQQPLVATIHLAGDPSCFSMCDGFAAASGSGGLPPYSYSWSTGATDSAVGLCSGVYIAYVTDVAGNTATDTITITDPDQILATSSITDASCGSCDGEIVVTATGGGPPVGGSSYRFLLHGAPDSCCLSNVFSGLCPGNYFLTVENISDGCTFMDTLSVMGGAGCFDTISGRVYHDVNGNCIQDTAEDGIPNILIDITPGGGVYTDASGDYVFIRDTGTYAVSSVLSNYYNAICPPSNSYTIVLDTPGVHSSGNDFALAIIPVQDLRASIFCGVIRPGFQQTVSFTITNDGTIPMSGVAEFSLDSRLTYAGGGFDSINIATNTSYWNFSGLGMNQSLTFYFTALVSAPPVVNIGDTIHHSLTVNPVAGDIDSADNTSSCTTIVRGSYDPNDKAVSPQGEGPAGSITQADSLMYYTIRFQNTGTDTAFTVVIKDTLDADLEHVSFQQGTSSHSYTVHFEEDEVVVFTFENILLPDSNVNEPASHGYITYHMKHRGILPFGTEITNRAAIYFDFNEPVITNTVINTISEPVAVREFHSIGADVRIYPNPASGRLTVESAQGTFTQITIHDAAGKRVFDSGRVNTMRHSPGLASLSNGIYFLHIRLMDGTKIVKKLIVQ